MGREKGTELAPNLFVIHTPHDWQDLLSLRAARKHCLPGIFSRFLNGEILIFLIVLITKNAKRQNQFGIYFFEQLPPPFQIL